MVRAGNRILGEGDEEVSIMGVGGTMKRRADLIGLQDEWQPGCWGAFLRLGDKRLCEPSWHCTNLLILSSWVDQTGDGPYKSRDGKLETWDRTGKSCE